jgi:hypothetical protein
MRTEFFWNAAALLPLCGVKLKRRVAAKPLLVPTYAIGWTQALVALFSLQKWEQGSRTPKLRVLAAFASNGPELRFAFCVAAA